MRSVAASNVAGQAKAVTSVLNTVIMAPCFIIDNAMPAVIHGNLRITNKYGRNSNYPQTAAAEFQTNYLM